MAIIKCKMCGGKLTVKEGQTVVCCDFCGTHQTLPIFDDEKVNSKYHNPGLDLLMKNNKV